MSDMVRNAREDYRIREKTLSLVRRVPEKDWIGEIAAIHRFVRDRIRYVGDICDLETIAEPWKTLQIGQGDCDDKSVLAAAMLQSINHPARFLAVGFNGEPISHVLVEALVGSHWIPLELTEQLELGEYPEGITSAMVEHISLKRR
jgi:transglutaminase-like putative cysteine protease